jgi:signal transduction histidine kinase
MSNRLTLPGGFSFPDWSVSTRLTLWYGLTLLVLLGLFAVFCYTSFHAGLHRDFDRYLQFKRQELLDSSSANGSSANSAEAVRSRFNPSALDAGTYQARGIDGTYVRLLSPEGKVLRQSPNFQAHAAFPVRLQGKASDDLQKTQVRRISHTWEGRPARTHYVPLQQSGALRGWLEVTGFEWSQHQGLRRLGWILLLGMALSLALAAGGGYFLARRALRPVAALTSAASGIGAARLDARLPVPEGPRDELTRLAETFNAMIERLETSFERERRFTANAAHELLTPLTTMRSEVEVARRRDRDRDGYRAVLDAVLEDTQAMTNAVRSLLALARTDRLREAGPGDAREAVNLSALAAESVQRFAGRAQDKSVVLACADAPPADAPTAEAPAAEVWVRADAELLGRGIIDNLLDNALKYTPGSGRVEVTAARRGDTALLRVADTGAGFAPDTAEHLFGRFFRSDAPEVQAAPGSGLGLAVARATALTFGGDITARSGGLGCGSTFELRLPLHV